jgi:hypothetical protein
MRRLSKFVRLHSELLANERVAIRGLSSVLAVLILSGMGLLTAAALGQTAETGALNGVITDPTGGVISGATIKVTNEATGESRSVLSGQNGSYLVPLLPPGAYRVEVSNSGFGASVYQGIHIYVTEPATLNVPLKIGTPTETIIVRAEASQLQTTSSALGHVTDQRMVENLPLVTRNYTQILGLSPGVSGDVTNAADIGRGITGESSGTGGYSVAGGATNDNNFQMNGTQVNDLEAEDGITGGVPIPNPDTIQEFKVQTGQYDASYGRNGGANVNVVTKSGTNSFHGDVWEYFRNSALNANDFFLNSNKQPRGVLDQNQFGFTLGGPIKKEKLMFFTSYQGTRERDGLGQSCLATGTLPEGLTNNASSRTAAGLGTEFGGQTGALGGTVATDGSNISPTALAVLNAQLSSGGFVVPAPQIVAGAPGAPNTTFSSPCRFNEDQFVTNMDWLQTDKSHLSGKFFFADSGEPAAFPGNQLGASAITVPGFPQTFENRFRVFSLTHTYAFNDHFLNEAVLGFHRLAGGLSQSYPNVKFANQACPGSVTGVFTLAGVCVPAPSFDNPFPGIVVQGSFNVGGNGQGLHTAENFYDFSDSLTYTRGKHSLQFGGGIDRSQINFGGFHFLAGLFYPSFPDFLLGNPLLSIDVPGVFDRAWRVWDGDLYVQDNYKVLPHLTLNLGLRYERQGALGEYLGRASTFDPTLANPDPPASGTLQGFVVASNFAAGTIPSDVKKASTNTAINNDGQNAWSPRVGFSWQLPGTNRLVLRGGYGIYYTRTTGEPFIQLLGAPPWGTIRQFVSPSLSTAFPSAPAFPIFAPYSPTTALTPTVFSPRFRPPVVQHYSMNLQTALAANWMLEVGYRGSRGTKLVQGRSFNQAVDATTNPVRGQTTNTLANIPLRVPIEGFDPAFSTVIESAGASWYNALQVSLSKRLSKGLQFLASYTWASALETSPGYATGAFTGGALLGNQDSPKSNYGFDNFTRPERLVVSYVYDLPNPQKLSSMVGRLLGGWSVAGVTTIQRGHRLTITQTNPTNAFGIVGGDQDRVQVDSSCTPAQLATSGSVTSRLTNYFNTSCITAPPVITSDGGTAFGNAGIGIVSGPDQRDFDIALIKKTTFGHSEAKNIEFRAEFFNAFNTPSFSDPVTGAGIVTGKAVLSSASFGQITSTSVSPRIIQLALKVHF